jgi:hypothetical protein
MFLKSISLAGVLLVARMPVFALQPVDVGADTQLMIDEKFITDSTNIALVIEPPIKTDELLLTSDKPWESVTLNWFTVLEDKGIVDTQAKYRMWYEAYDVKGWPTSDDTSFCYAESRDGIHWTKPELSLCPYGDHAQTNILFRQVGAGDAKSRVHGASVFIDPKAAPNERFKAISQGIFANYTPPHHIAGMYSPDGLTWTRYDKPIVDIFADSQYSGFWDKSLRKYVIYGRVAGRGRAIGRHESSDFSSFDGPLTRVLQVDDRDPADSDFYNPAAMKYPFAPGVYLMFPSLFEHRPDTLDIRLSVSRDGINWTRPQQDKPYIPLGKAGSFDSGSLYMGQGMIRVGEELWMYYSGSPLKHAEVELENISPSTQRKFSRVVTKLDRFVAVEAGQKEGSFTTPVVTFSGNILKLNVRAQEGGFVRVGLLDENGKPLPGRSVDECKPITGDHLDQLVTWDPKGYSDVTHFAGRPIRLHFEMQNAKLYTFRFTVGHASTQRDR